ncbi:MAG TPA: cation diffusion facilitator family transporter [Solirubrobacteraceae bacterium]
MSGSPSQVSRRSLPSTREAGASRKTVIIALVANALVAVAKLIGGLISGSTALLAEAAHSVADTTNQGFLLGSIALAAREPSERHPFGHGNQRFLWTFMAAVGMFVAGAVFAVGYGVIELLSGSKEEGGFAAAWITLAIALVAEGISWLRALRQTRGEARQAGRPVAQYVRESRDPSVKMVLFEDTAALVGIVIAAVGIALHQITGAAYWDPIASIFIGVLLIAVAARMATDTGRLLVGAAARPDEVAAIERVLDDNADVAGVLELLTMVLGPNALLVGARVDLADGVVSERLERAMSDLDREIRAAVPDVTEVFLDPTPARGD